MDPDLAVLGVCCTKLQNSSNTFSCKEPPGKVHSLQNRAELRNSVRVEKCAADPAEATPPGAGMHLQTLDRERVCQPNLPLIHIPPQYVVNFIRSPTVVLFLQCFSTSS